VLAALQTHEDSVDRAVKRMQEELTQIARKQGVDCAPDEEIAIRTHIMSKCLYGVDLDPVAVHIARIALKERAFMQSRPIPGIEPHIRVGNALVGSASGPCDTGDAHDKDDRHAEAYFGKKRSKRRPTCQWVEEKRVFHWAHEFPEVFPDAAGGFDLVIGNPPYEIVSVKESGIRDRQHDQVYFRATYRSCQGKINTYRLMMERGLALLRGRGVLGFIVPATLLADSTAEKLRKIILDESRILEALVISEKAQVFEGVTQALLVLILRKGKPTLTLEPMLWDGTGPVPHRPEVTIGRNLIARIGHRIPRLKTRREKALLELLMRYPPLAGEGTVPPVVRVRQGEMNLTVDRAFITNSKTHYPLIRGEHVMPLRVSHPSSREGRLDWVIPEFLERQGCKKRIDRNYSLGIDPEPGPAAAAKAWEQERIVLGRVVNMETKRRLKAALVAPGQFLGDMTNFIADPVLPHHYLLGLLNSRLLNWRIRLTSANNYLSAAEVEFLPVPRPARVDLSPELAFRVRRDLAALLASYEGSTSDWVHAIRKVMDSAGATDAQAMCARTVELIVSEIREDPQGHLQGRDPTGNLWNALDATVLILYGCEAYVDVVNG
jgi:adenine-specific DNA-methyltransferase